MKASAILSTDRKYHYVLRREWKSVDCKAIIGERVNQFLNVIGLNPSTADETKDDPTIRRCIDFAQRFGFGALCMTNLFAYRATYPRELLQVNDPIGPDNLAHLVETVADENCGIVIAAWGRSVPIVAERAVFTVELLRRFREIHCLGINRDGSPKHPLYLSADTLDSIFATHRPIENKPEVIVHPARFATALQD